MFGIPRASFTTADYTMFVHAFSVVARIGDVLFDWRISKFLLMYVVFFLLVPRLVKSPRAMMIKVASFARSRTTRKIIMMHDKTRIDRFPRSRNSTHNSDLRRIPGVVVDWRLCFCSPRCVALFLVAPSLERIRRRIPKIVVSSRWGGIARSSILRRAKERINRYLRTERNYANVRNVFSTIFSWIAIIYMVYVVSQDAGEKDAERKLLHPTIVEVYLRGDGNSGTAIDDTYKIDEFAQAVQARSKDEGLSLLWRNRDETIVVSLEACKDVPTTCEFRTFRIDNEYIRGIVYVGKIGD